MAKPQKSRHSSSATFTRAFGCWGAARIGPSRGRERRAWTRRTMLQNLSALQSGVVRRGSGRLYDVHQAMDAMPSGRTCGGARRGGWSPSSGYFSVENENVGREAVAGALGHTVALDEALEVVDVDPAGATDADAWQFA